MVKNNRIDENDLRAGLKEKARLAREQSARSKVREREEEIKEGVRQEPEISAHEHGE